MTDRAVCTPTRILRGALAGFIAGVAAASQSDDDQQTEPATEQAADGIARTLTGRAVTVADKPLAGWALHYALGIGSAPWKTAPSGHLYSYVSHLVFGGATEFVRRQVAMTLSA